ncbi:MAG: ammonium transporter, Amt family [Gaiellaceae bacterium]|jgi:Amt family ammonium transporter|nr:ammonium transporter, Amt family [Gaiellaceae bacterium]
MTKHELLIAVSTVWVLLAAFLVMFMQAGFALLEAGLTRMKNAGHIAAKNVLIFAICSVVYWAVGFGLAFGDGGALVGTQGFFPSADQLIAVGEKPFSFFTEIPGAAGYLFEVVFAGVSLAIVWGAMAERAKLWVYFVFGVFFTLVYSVVSHWIWHSSGWLFSKGMQDFAGSTVVHYQGALAALAGAILLGPRIGKFGKDGRANPIPGHNVPFAVLGTLILWLGWFGFNPGSTLSVDFGGVGYFAYVALTTNVAAAAGGVGGILTAWLVLRKPDISMMLNGVIAALVAVTAACGYVAPWAAALIGLVASVIAVYGVMLVERIGIDDPIGAVSVHGLAGVWGTLATGLFAVPSLAERLGTGTGGLFYTGSFHQLGVQALGLLAVGSFTFAMSFGALWTMKRVWGIRVEDHVETAGLDVSEHGMWGYPEFYIPVPGGYGTETHGHLGLRHAPRAAPVPHPVPAPEPS